MNLLDAFNFEQKIKKLNGEELRALIMTEAKLLAEDANPKGVDPERFPLQLSKAAAKVGAEAEALVTGGGDDGDASDDVVKANQAQIPCSELKPSQSSMNIEKACQFALCALMKVKPFKNGPGGDLGAIITSDMHIMDGHHRWIASGMVDPTSSVGGFLVEFPAKQMIAALNMITVGLGITKGKPGSGGFDQFNEKGILVELQKIVADGFWGGEAAACQAALEAYTGESGEGAVSAAAKKMGANVSRLTLSVPSGFPARPDMPVISKDKGHLEQAIKLLRQGKVDLNEPYAKGPKEENASLQGEVITERWEKLAGLIT